MWVIARNIPSVSWILAPRAPYPADGDGFSWLPPGGGMHSSVDEYIPALQSLVGWLDGLAEIKDVNQPLDVVGFSQGAAAAYALILSMPDRVNRLAGLAGFLPAGTDRFMKIQPLLGKKVFIAHGRQDERIRIEAGYQAATGLTRAGAEVDFCEADTGHKLSSDCHRRRVQFLMDGSAPAYD